MTDFPGPPPGAMPPPPPPPPPPPGVGPLPSYQAYPQQYDASPQYASFGARLGAFLIDAIAGLVFSIPAIVVIFSGPRHIARCTINDEQRLCNVPNNSTIALAVLLAVAGSIAYLVIFCRKVSRNQSWGMKATGIRVVSAEGSQQISAWRALGWQLAHVFSGFFCYLGYLWMLWDKRNQTWHDKIAGTVIVKA